MKISLTWMNEYVDVRDFMAKPSELAQKLTSAGIEVEGVTDLATQFKNVVVGHIIEFGRHPNADRLTLCQVDVGDGKTRQIVCGAKNHKQGDKVVACLPGAVLPGNFEIKLSKIRDVESQGMLASESELGFKAESEGILILPKEAKVGQSFAEYYGLSDVIFELSVTPNRADCLSHYGLAREVACLLGRPFKIPVPEIKTGGADTAKTVGLEVKSELCPRYAGRLIKGVKVGPSPQWLKQRLEAIDLKSINNVVDITNYVMMELGQPLHAFDLKELNGKKIVVDLAKAGESFVSLDGTEVKLGGDELMIRDGSRPVAMAGVVGGKNSGVTEATTDLFIESAHFLPDTVRRTSRKFGIETDSAYRFSRGTDPDVVLLALNRACELIQKTAGGQVAADVHDHYPKPSKAQAIAVNLKYVEDRLGYPVQAEDFQQWMKRLSCQIQKGKAAGQFEVTPPVYRWDIKSEIDLIEEYARLHGYEHIPETLPALISAPATQDKNYLLENRVVSLLAENGFHQAVNYGFLSSTFQQKFLGERKKLQALGLQCSLEEVKLHNPLNEELNVMRVSLLPWLFTNVLHNYRHGREFGRLFECGYVFSGGAETKEFLNMGLVAWGQKPTLWSKDTERLAIYDLKTEIENMLLQLQITNYQWKQVVAAQVPDFAHPGQCAGLFVEGRMLGFISSIHPLLAEEEKLRHSLALAEIDVEKLMRGQPRPLKTTSFSKFPVVQRDLAFVLPPNVQAAELIKEIMKVGAGIIHSTEIFDVFIGGDLPEGHRSVAYRMLCQDQQGTLSEEQLAGLQAKVISAIEGKFKVKVR